MTITSVAASAPASSVENADLHNYVAPIHRQWHVVNPGSVGLTLDGDPCAQFAMLESVPGSKEPGGWQVTHHRIPDDRRPALEAFSVSGMLEAGGVISRLFYWELVSGEPEIIRFYRWAYANGRDPDKDGVHDVFAQYKADLLATNISESAFHSCSGRNGDRLT